MYAFTARCTYVQRIGLRGLGVVPTVDIAHYEYHYLSSCGCAENRAIAPLIFYSGFQVSTLSGSLVSRARLLMCFVDLPAKVKVLKVTGRC